MKYLEVKLHYVYNYFKNTSENKRKKCFKTKNNGSQDINTKK